MLCSGKSGIINKDGTWKIKLGEFNLFGMIQDSYKNEGQYYYVEFTKNVKKDS